MSSTQSDNVSERRPVAKDLSTPGLRAVRKQLLIIRADLEREELGQATAELRQAVASFNWIKFLVPSLWQPTLGAAKNTGTQFGSLLKQYPLLSSLASLLLAKPLRTTLIASAVPILKWGSLSFAAWETYRVWKQIRRDTRKDAR